MATPMQYEMVNGLLNAHNSPGFAGSPPALRGCVLAMQKLVGAVPMVDCTDAVRVLLNSAPPTEADKKVARRNYDSLLATLSESEQALVKERQSKWPEPTNAPDEGRASYFDPIPYMAILKPFDNEIPMAWPVCLMSFVHDGIGALFAVRQHIGANFGFSATTYSVFCKDGRVGVAEAGKIPGLSSEVSLLSLEMIAASVALAIAAAKNAQWIESQPNRATRRRHPGLAGIRFQHIEVDMGKPKRKGGAREEPQSHGVPWHHRRGHWAYVTPERPLFGHHGPKNSGWFWRPYTEVGDKAHGEIVQDYSVMGNLPQRVA